MLKRIFLFIVTGNLLFISCSKEESAPPVDFLSEFYPLKVSSVIIYEVDSTAYNNFTGTSLNFKFQLKDSITNSFDDLAGITNYRIERYKKSAPSNQWIFQRVFTRNKSTRAAEEFINNQRFVRLIFPPLPGSSWNGNSKNTLGEQEYYIENDIAPLTIKNLSFDSTLVVQEVNDTNLIREDIVFSTYAKNIGLVKKEVTAIDKNISSGKITNGSVYTYTILSYK